MSTRTRICTVMLCIAAVAPPAMAVASIAEYLLPIIYEHGVDVAIADYYEARRDRRNEFSFAENELNLLGYRLLRDKRLLDAVAILELNVEMYPLSANAHDSLAEAYMRLGDSARAKKEYMRALSMLKRPDSARRVNRGFLERNIQLQLERIEAYPVFEPLVGMYRAEDGRVLSISITETNHGRAPPQLRLVEFPSGTTRTLHAKSERSYFTGPALDLRSPMEERFEFSKPSDGESSPEIRIRGDGETTRARRVPITSETVSFNNGDVELEGTLLLPDNERPAPSVILVHGSGKATRNAPGFGELAHYLVLNGYAVLRYDKRGWGDSSMGESNTAVLRQLAGDALAAYHYLEGRRDIDPERIGIAGFSEGAWVAGLAAASRSASPDFVVLLSGGGVAPWRQELYRVEAELRAEGFGDAHVAKALEFMNLKFAVAQTSSEWDTFAAAMRSNRRESWYKYAFGWPSLQFAQMAWDEVLGYEPESVLRRIDCPVLALLGEKDVLTPVDTTEEALRSAFEGDRAVLLQISRLPEGNHLLLEAETGSVRFTDELASTRRYATGYFQTLATWLAGRPGSSILAETSAK